MPRLTAVLALAVSALVAPAPAANAETCSGPPAVPGPITATASADGSTVTYSWGAVPGATEYLTWWDENRESGGISAITTATSQTVPVSYERAAYLFEVAARGPCGQSTYAIKTSPSRLPFPADKVQAFPGRRTLYVTWMPADPRGNLDLSEVHYKVTTQPGGRTCQVDSASALGCTVTGLTIGRRYTATVEAFNELGTTPPASLDKPVQIVIGPTAPRSVEADTGLTSAVVSWKPPAKDGGRPVVRYTATAASSGRSCTTTGDTCTIRGLRSGTPYQFVVVADNGRAKGEPGFSFPMSTKSPPPPEPTPEPKPSAPIS